MSVTEHELAPRQKPRVTDLYAARIAGLMYGLHANPKEQQVAALVPVLEDFLADRVQEIEGQVAELSRPSVPALLRDRNAVTAASKFMKETK